VCNDFKKCTKDTCDPVDGCVYIPIVCPATGDFCLIAETCDETSGGCPVTPRNCNDSIACTVDTCSSTTNKCVHTPDNFYCQDPNPCVVNPVCTLTGCANQPLNCSLAPERQTFCTNWVCIDFEGCSGEPRYCANEINGTDTCIVFNCSETKKECDKTESPCLVFFGIVAGIVVAGVVIGVIAAALIIAGASAGGASVAISNSHASEKNQSVNSNPLYRGHGKGKDVGLA
jgi:hypothetical protein